MSEEQVTFNGIDIATGKYLIAPTTLTAFADLVRKEQLELIHPLTLLLMRSERSQGHLGVRYGINPLNLAQTGWGIVFPATSSEQHMHVLKAALEPLLKLRQEQAGNYYHEFSGLEHGCRANDTYKSWLVRNFTAPGEPADPRKVPYYLLLIGSPEEISFQFQYDLDVVYAVGRLSFEQEEDESSADVLEKYARYALSVERCERGQRVLPRRMAIFGVANDSDPSTHFSLQLLAAPVNQELLLRIPDSPPTICFEEKATKERLGQLLNASVPPALLFTVSHGLSMTEKQPDLPLRHVGALLCQDWPGPDVWNGKGIIPERFYFSADDLKSSASLEGCITFHFACHGAGTTRRGNPFAPLTRGGERISSLPQHLLSHPNGSALAVIGNVSEIWGYSFSWPPLGSQNGTFVDFFYQLLCGERVGKATEELNQRYSSSLVGLHTLLQDIKYHAPYDSRDLAGMWAMSNDTRNYIILGDPAVKLPLAENTL